MQDHLKERLTGAAILVVVVVLLVPELFRGPPATKLKQEMAAAGPPVLARTTIDLRDGAVAEPPAASAPESTAPAAAAVSAPAGGTVNAPSVASTPPSPTSVNVAPPAAAAPATPALAAAAASPHGGGAAKTGWTVQVGSFARRDYAERMVKQVAAKGFSVEVAGPEGDAHGLYRGLAPRHCLPQHAAALAMKQKMQASGLKPIVNSAP